MPHPQDRPPDLGTRGIDVSRNGMRGNDEEAEIRVGGIEMWDGSGAVRSVEVELDFLEGRASL